MAIWQYTFLVLPKDSVEALSSDYRFEKREDWFDDELYWRLNRINKDFFQAVQKILPKNKSWSNQIYLYGNQESNCFELLCDNEGDVLSVSFRIDFRSNYERVLSQIIEFCSLNGLVILDEGLNLVPCNYEQLQSIIERSPQVKKYNELGAGSDDHI